MDTMRTVAVFAIATLLLFGSGACSDNASSTPSTVAPVEESTAQDIGSKTLAGENDPTALMRATLGYLFGPSTKDPSIISRMGQSGDQAFVPVLVELMFFQSLLPRSVKEEIRPALVKLTGQDFGVHGWPDWIMWLGEHPEVPRPPDYADWKGSLYQLIDPQISLFFRDEATAQIRLEQIVWGGVEKDGIPDLTDPHVIPSEQATYLDPDDRVFGVSINGEHRAYPLRIMNPHEMANDVVGGEPIALAY